MPFPNDNFTDAGLAQAALITRLRAAGMAVPQTFNDMGIVLATLANSLVDLPAGSATGQLAALKLTANAQSGAGTAAAGDLTGAAVTVCTYNAVGAATLTTRTAAQMVADGGLTVGSAYLLVIRNTSGGTTTIGQGAGVTVSGTATLATNTYRLFAVTVQSPTALTLTNLGSGSV